MLAKRSVARGVVVALAVLGMSLPSVTFAASPEAPVVTDVKLQEGAILVGVTVDDQGARLAGTPVSLRSSGEELAVGATNPDGIFAFRGVHQGIYQVASGKSVGTFRVWTVETAPPAAQQAAMVVVTDGVVRGQTRMGTVLTNPLVIGAGIATAIAVPVAVANSNRHSSSN